MPTILKVIDKSDNNVIDMGLLPNVGLRGIIVGKSGTGKTNIIINWILNPQFGYDKIFKGENIYIFSGSLDSDKKIQTLIDAKDIPSENLFSEFSDDALNGLYDQLEEEFLMLSEEGAPINYPLVIIDDMSFSGGLHKGLYNALARFYCNCRKLAISIITTTQYYNQILPSVRENISFAIFFNTSFKQLEGIEAEHNYLDGKKAFTKMFRDNVKGRKFLAIVYDNEENDIYLNSDFEPIKLLKKV